LIGVIAIGIGLGLEFKIIEVKNGLSRGSRIAACVVGAALIATSIALYLRPSQTASTTPPVDAAAVAPAASTPAQEVTAQSALTAAQAEAPTIAPAAVLSETLPPAPTEVPTVVVPDIRGLSPKDATKRLGELGLELGERQESCAALGVRDEQVAETKKDRIACQSVEPGSNASLGSSVAYALTKK
jgi:hypothetical protein